MKKTTILRSFYNLIVLLLLIAGVYLVVNHFVHFGDGEFTDNATVQRQITPVNTRVSGFIKEIRFEEFQQVHKGDTLVIIEDSEFRLRLAQAEADLANALAGKEVTATGMQTTDQSIRVADAGIEEARVQLDNARREEERYAQLLKDDAVTPQQYDQVHTAYLAAQARYEQATRSIGTLSSAKQEQGHRVKVQLDNARREEERYAQLLKDDAVTPQQYDQVHTAYLAAQARYEQATRSIGTLSSAKQEQGHRVKQNKAGIDLARSQVRMARLNLSYTVITATADGVVGKKQIHEGQLVQPGQTLVDIVDNTDLWVVANFRETQMPHISVGRKVRMTADAVPGVVFWGTVERISDATGSAFSLIPQDNATGNFVKVEQRIPVRIRFKSRQNIQRLRAGMNMECTAL